MMSCLDLNELLYVKEADVEQTLAMQVPFNYYYYKGSLTSPPCDEDVYWFVLSEPQHIGLTALELFRRVLEIPELEADD